MHWHQGIFLIPALFSSELPHYVCMNMHILIFPISHRCPPFPIIVKTSKNQNLYEWCLWPSGFDLWPRKKCSYRLCEMVFSGPLELLFGMLATKNGFLQFLRKPTHSGADEGNRTLYIQLGKLTFYRWTTSAYEFIFLWYCLFYTILSDFLNEE